ncbi:hypothetical protein CBS101457_001145 [Exobasidium rhododendri]|nr:hypothetical protein CBS101457_001145 [Exobasidium rhododendri]
MAIVIPTITIFLPRSLSKRLTKYSDANLLFGWSFPGGPTDDKLIVVVAGLVSPRKAAMIPVHAARITKEPKTTAGIVGECSFAFNDLRRRRPSYKQGDLWLEVGLPEAQESTNLPRVHSIMCPLICDHRAQCAINVVLYTIPNANRMSFLSLDPLVLTSASSAAGVLDRPKEEEKIRKEETGLRSKLEDLIRLDPLRHEELSKDYPLGRAPGEGFHKAVILLNYCSYLNESITKHDFSDSSRNINKQAWPSYGVILMLWRVIRSSCQRARSVLNIRIRARSLTDISAAACQLELRLGQGVTWPSIALQLRRQRRKEYEPASKLAPRYIALYNGVWLVLNDLILGQTIGKWLCDNHEAVGKTISSLLRPVLVKDLIDTLSWLDHWPLGLKLNTQLSRFFCDLFVGLAMAWDEVVITRLIANEGQSLGRLIYWLGISSRLMGLTMLISILVDLLRLLTLHWSIFYRIQQAIFQFFTSSIASLFYLFRGKKRNPLRKNRTDDAVYDLDQLLLGTIFFTLFVFLFLTVIVYYFYFSLLRFAIVGIITVLETGLVLLNHLPLFALMLRAKDPDRIPGGIEMRLLDDRSRAHNSLACTYFELHTNPLTLQDIFRGYNGHLQAIRNLPRLFGQLLLGRRY